MGGGELARPGEVSLAHQGVLFLDELSEFRRGTLEALRQPLEDGFVTVSRVQMTATFPARPLLIGATNPCPCGHRGDGTERCHCRPDQLRAYRSRLSGPLVDRLDLHVVLPPVDVMSLQSKAPGERSSEVRARVEQARAIQRARMRDKETNAGANGHLGAKDIERVCALDRLGTIKWRVAGTPFQRKVWTALPAIPPGTTMSYGALATRLDMPRAIRAVGHANGSNPLSVVVPCHRLIGANGSLVKYGGGLERKRWLLAHEGVVLMPASRRRLTTA